MMRVVVVDDQQTPYRIPIYERLAREVDSLSVLYCAQQLRYQKFEPPPVDYDHRVLPNWVIRLQRPPFGEPRFVLLNPTLIAEVLRARPTVVTGYAFSLPAWSAYLGARLRGAGYISWSTDTLHTERHFGPGQRLSRRLLIGAADAYLTPSSAGRAKFLAYGAPAEKIFHVPQRTILNPLPPRGTMADTCTFLFVGSLSERKGVDLLLDAFRQVAAARPEARLCVVGDGPRRAALERQAEAAGVRDQVKFTGFVQPHLLPSLYQRADIFVFPSLEDTFGVALADAAAAGLPILGSVYAGACSDFVRPGRNGFKIDPDQINSMAEYMIRLAGDVDLRAEMSAASLEIARELSVSHAVQQFRQALQIANAG